MILTLNDGTIDTGAAYIDFAATLAHSGQAFRFEAGAGGVSGVALSRLIHIRQDGERARIDITTAEYEAVWQRYFALDDDYAPLFAAAAGDPFLAKCIAFCGGIRVLRQDLWETLVTFIISQRNNIPRIRGIVENLCAAYGAALGGGVYAFPAPEALAKESDARLSARIGAGYRGDYIVRAAQAWPDGGLREALAGGGHLEALQSIKGVGVKVANCVSLFGLHNLDAFPVDTWMQRIIDKAYGGALDPARFAPLAGVAQQYMFRYALAHKDEFRF